MSLIKLSRLYAASVTCNSFFYLSVIFFQFLVILLLFVLLYCAIRAAMQPLIRVTLLIRLFLFTNFINGCHRGCVPLFVCSYCFTSLHFNICMFLVCLEWSNKVEYKNVFPRNIIDDGKLDNINLSIFNSLRISDIAY